MNRRWLSLSAGLLFAIYPGVLAVLGLQPLLAGQFSRLPHRWLLTMGGVLWLVPSMADAVSGQWSQGSALEIGQLACLMLVYFGGLLVGGSSSSLSLLPRGLFLGLSLIAGASVFYSLTGQDRVSGWLAHPNIWASTVLMPVIAVFLISKSHLVRFGASGLAILVVALSGSRTAGTILLVGFLYFGLEAAFHRARTLGVRMLAVVAVATLLVGVYAAMALVQPRFVQSAADIFRFEASKLDVPLLGSAQTLGVKVTQGNEGIVRIESIDSNWWSRLQYPMLLFPGKTYSVRVKMLVASPGASPGIVGVVSGADRLIVGGAGGWSARGEGTIRVVDFRAEEASDGWADIAVSFRSEEEKTARMWIGPAPNLDSDNSGAAILMQGPIAIVGDLSGLPSELSIDRISLASIEALARISSFAAGWNGFLEAPIFGQRNQHFTEYYRNNPPTQNTAVPSHAHNLIIQSLYSMGLMGTLGLVLILGWVTAVVGRSRIGPRGIVLVLAAIAANIFDVTLWSAGTMYFLFGFAGVVTASAPTRLPQPELVARLR